MRRFQEKKKWQFLLSSWPAIFVLTVILCVFAFGVFDFIGKLEDTEKNKKNAQEKVMELKNRKTSLETDLEFLGTEEGREKVLRQDFGLAKAGESVIVLVDEEESAPIEEKKGFFRFLKKGKED